MLVLSALCLLQALNAFPLERKKIKFSTIYSAVFDLGNYFIFLMCSIHSGNLQSIQGEKMCLN